MSISAALANAVSGLTATGRQAQAVSSNIANAQTPGYGRREVELSSGRFGGVQIDNVQRIVNATILFDRRLADAQLSGEAAIATALDQISGLFGAANDPASLSGRVAQLESALIEAASRPESNTRLAATAEAARSLALSLNRASDGIQVERLRADENIARDVETLRTGLDRVDQLNAEIVRSSANGKTINGLVDQRQTVIDTLSEIVPLRELPRANGTVALMTTSGQVLLEDRPAEIDFTKAIAISPQAVLGTPLSGITVNGNPIDMGAANNRLQGGRLAALFDIRDRVGVDAQANLDAVARDLTERFDAPALDPTTAATDAGLFSDGANRFGPADEIGYAGRIALNALVDPSQGGQVWRLRDGFGAAAVGESGDARLLNAFSNALGESRVALSGNLGPVGRSAGGLADALLSDIGGALFVADQNRTFTSSRAATLLQQELSEGVDTDQEMQKLLLLEQAYSANAKIIEAADAMLQRLLEI